GGDAARHVDGDPAPLSRGDVLAKERCLAGQGGHAEDLGAADALERALVLFRRLDCGGEPECDGAGREQRAAVHDPAPRCAAWASAFGGTPSALFSRLVKLK